MEEQQLQVAHNYARFNELLPQILAERRGSYALMKNGEIVGYFVSAQEADLCGLQNYPDGIFSVQEVTDAVLQSGGYGHAPV